VPNLFKKKIIFLTKIKEIKMNDGYIHIFLKKQNIMDIFFVKGGKK
jgi:hypothetical protein